jgi:hypothetical protein
MSLGLAGRFLLEYPDRPQSCHQHNIQSLHNGNSWNEYNCSTAAKTVSESAAHVRLANTRVMYPSLTDSGRCPEHHSKLLCPSAR